MQPVLSAISSVSLGGGAVVCVKIGRASGREGVGQDGFRAVVLFVL